MESKRFLIKLYLIKIKFKHAREDQIKKYIKSLPSSSIVVISLIGMFPSRGGIFLSSTS